MIETPMGETVTVEELVKFALVKQPAEPGWLPGEGELQPALDTTHFPIIIRVIERPAIIHITEDDGEQRIEVVAEAETRDFVLESEDIEVADNAVWLIVGPRPEEGD